MASCVVVSARAQSTTAFGVEAGVWNAFDESVLQVGFRVAPTHGGFGTIDFAFATFPEAVSHGIILFQMDFDITHGVPKEDSPVAFFPRGGISFLTAGALSGGGGGAVIGYNVGAGLFLRGSSKVGFRVDYTYRRFRGLEQPLASITAGVVFLP